MYKNCGNNLNVTIPALGSQFNPEYSITGGEIKNHGSGRVTIVPKSRNVEITVRNNGVPVGKLNFKAKAVPSATFITNLDIKRGVTRSQLARVSLKAKAPDEFEELLPRESHYNLDEVMVFHTRNGHLVSQQKVKGGIVKLSSVRSDAREGDIIVFEVIKASRKNYKGEREEAKINNTIISVRVRG